MVIISKENFKLIRNAILIYVFLIIPFMFFFSPDTALPAKNIFAQFIQKIQRSMMEIWEKLNIFDDLSEQNSGSSGSSNTNRSNSGSMTNILQILLNIIIFGMIFYALYFVIKKFNITKSSGTSINSNTEEENFIKLKFTRDISLSILERGLSSGKYSEAVYEAYVELDKALDNYREVSRPKYWTPKEYAYRVSKPIFRPNVYNIVNIFYKVNYGGQIATQADVLTFKNNLIKLFENENSEIEIISAIERFKIIEEEWVKEYQITPFGTDYKKPISKIKRNV
ncbi:MAG: hypothetical protein OEY49_05950 [Candidatus Heimdallarchaeota archaeon]|nr:hypothetical protein [Candidatus Heimdallarchaeota archaeon]